ncbi:putative triacylglycerol lipase [Rosa chinensis]|uniref:Putative triacylglycerol lipase n=2 Tax=Rosa chinensis TaxID=74649 RepID=A0A2P6PGS8_ROSCH|nr:putative triacylglycerol lipase [Rosa chinensis]
MSSPFVGVFAFGDSVLDTGNNNDLPTVARCNFPPYGRDFIGGIPTGRFSNGKVYSDIIVEALGIKHLLPAYLDPNLHSEDLPTGVCFASGNSGYDPLTPSLVDLYSLGARRIAIISAFPLGCAPLERNGGGLLGECLELQNQRAKMFNSLLSSELDTINRDFPDAKLVFLDVYHPFLELNQHPENSGFEVLKIGCCGTGTFEVTSFLCNPWNPFTCSNASNYVYWDAIHPSERAQRIVASQTLKLITST